MANQLIHFGKLSLLYEDGFVRYVRAGEIEIVRKIFFALRDSNWVTAEVVRTDERVLVKPERFEISYTATNVVGGKEVFRWFVKITGSETGEIDFSVDGEALASYNRNRAGIGVLHPIRETKNRVATVTRPDGSVYEKEFPSIISPHQPFMDIRKMVWPIDGEVKAELEFEGDIFEMEDQRNWSDTSFKTYSTPLSVPFPVMLKPGDKVNQRVTMRLINSDRLPDADLEEDIKVIVGNELKSFPKIGTEFPGSGASAVELDLVSNLKFEHLRVEVIFSNPSWKEKLKLGVEEAGKLKTNVFIHLILDKPDQWDEFASENISDVTKIAISPLDRKANLDSILHYIVPKARQNYPNASIGAGYISYFTELNRNRFDYSQIDFVIYPLNPQAHSQDTLTIVENLPAQEDAVKSAINLANGKSVHVGLISIKQRFNPDAKSGKLEISDSRFDPRHLTALAAGWALASIKYLSEGGAESITLFELHGPAGYVSGNKLFPVYNALLSLRKLNPKRVIASWCNEPLVVSSLVVEDESSTRHLILINHSGSRKFVTVSETLYTLGEYEIQFIKMK